MLNKELESILFVIQTCLYFNSLLEKKQQQQQQQQQQKNCKSKHQHANTLETNLGRVPGNGVAQSFTVVRL